MILNEVKHGGGQKKASGSVRNWEGNVWGQKAIYLWMGNFGTPL